MPGKVLRSAGYFPGLFETGPCNCIVDVAGVKVGHLTLIEGQDVRTGVTAILPHAGNIYHDRLPAGLAVGNGFGKMAGVSQIQELGELETPILLTNTLAVPRAVEALITWTLSFPGMDGVQSINALVGETNDGYLNDIRARALTVEHMLAAMETAVSHPVTEGSVGAGTGTVCFGWKGGIGTSSRRLTPELGGYTVGILVQANYGGDLHVLGLPVGRLLNRSGSDQKDGDGSIMIIIATDAPLSDRNLTRLAWRAFGGLARTGSALANESGDYALAFSTAESVRRTPERRGKLSMVAELPNDLLTPLFQMAIEGTEEAIYNALTAASIMQGFKGRTVNALPVERVLELLEKNQLIAKKRNRD